MSPNFGSDTLHKSIEWNPHTPTILDLYNIFLDACNTIMHLWLVDIYIT